MTNTILAIDRGKFNSVICAFDSDTREASFRTANTTPAILRAELLRQPVVSVGTSLRGPTSALTIENESLLANSRTAIAIGARRNK